MFLVQIRYSQDKRRHLVTVMSVTLLHHVEARSASSNLII